MTNRIAEGFNNLFKRVSIEKSVCSFKPTKVYALFEINVSGG